MLYYIILYYIILYYIILYSTITRNPALPLTKRLKSCIYKRLLAFEQQTSTRNAILFTDTAGARSKHGKALKYIMFFPRRGAGAIFLPPQAMMRVPPSLPSDTVRPRPTIFPHQVVRGFQNVPKANISHGWDLSEPGFAWSHLLGWGSAPYHFCICGIRLNVASNEPLICRFAF